MSKLSLFDATMIVEGIQEVDTFEEYCEAAQVLIDTGAAWKLQGFFGRTCARLIEEGYCNGGSGRGDNLGGSDAC